MAFSSNGTTKDVICDKCKKPASVERPIIEMWTSGRSYEDRNFINLHIACLNKTMNKVSEQLAAKPETVEAVQS